MNRMLFSYILLEKPILIDIGANVGGCCTQISIKIVSDCVLLSLYIYTHMYILSIFFCLSLFIYIHHIFMSLRFLHLHAMETVFAKEPVTKAMSAPPMAQRVSRDAEGADLGEFN